MKKTRSRWYLGCLLTLAAAGSAFGAFNENMAYFNLYQAGNELLLEQSGEGCVVPVGPGGFFGFAGGAGAAGRNCLASVGPFTTAAEVNEGLYEIVSKHWTAMQWSGLRFTSDIDLGGFDEKTPDGACDAQFHPLDFPETSDGLVFNGGKSDGFIIKNLCYVHDVKDSAMSKPIGFFSQLPRGMASNAKLKNVRIIVKDTREDRDATSAGEDFYPVGAFFGMASMSTIADVVLEDVTINAPLAGGIAGYVSNSTIRGIQATDDLVVTNDIPLASADGNFAGNVVGKMHSNALERDYSTWPSQYTVFLGGIVGMAVQDSIYDTRIRGKIFDKSGTASPSALGGLAGMMAYLDLDYATFNDTLEMKPASPAGGAGFTTISGGRAMGGLFGEVAYMPWGVLKEYSFKNVVVDSVRILNSASDNVYAGGLVGRIWFQNGNRVKILNSHAKVDISDSLGITGKHAYYAGGLVGTTAAGSSGTNMDCNSAEANGQENTAFLSIADSRTSGSIRVAANAAQVNKLDADAYLGGVAGAACFVASSEAIHKVTSSVKVESAVKTGSKNVFVGGIAGKVDFLGSNKVLAFKDLRFEGSLVAADSADKVYMGGILGGFMTQLRSVSFASTSVAATSGVTAEIKSNGTSVKGSEAYVGGICGYCARVAEVSQVSVAGNIAADDENFGGDSLFVGGLFGLVESDLGMVVKNTFSVGNIGVKVGSPAKSGVSVGYIAGRAKMTGTLARKFISNYHFSAVDEFDAFGKLFNGETDVTASWKDGVSNWTISYNVRNGESESLSANNSGALLAADMKVAEFAGELNRGQSPLVWTFETGENQDLPFFVDASHQAVAPSGAASYTVIFVYYAWDEEAGVFVSKNHTVTAEAGATVASVAPEVPEREGYTFTGWDKADKEIVANITVTAQYSINHYTVTFVNGEKELQKKELPYQTVPSYEEETPVKAANDRYSYRFVGWTPEIVPVTKNAVYMAMFDSIPNRFRIRFVSDASTMQEGDWEAGSLPSCDRIPERPATTEYTYTFVGWTPEITIVTGPQTYTAVFDSVSIATTYKVTFLNNVGEILDVQDVKNGSSAVAPAFKEPEGYEFIGWSKSFDNVTSDLVVLALVKAVVPESSSSSKEPESSSSSVVPESSSAVEIAELEIVKPLIEQSGNAVRLTFGTDSAVASGKVSARVQVLGDAGVILDTLISDSLTDKNARSEWEMFPAPIGKFKVVLTLEGFGKQATYDTTFEVASEIAVTPRSWQMVSLAALDESNRFDPDADALYWWDEENPVGEYWQYRSYKAGEAKDPARGYWYGTRNGNPLVLKEEASAGDSKIVWELDNVYSGWNLVANPHGWYVDLGGDNGGKVIFWQWDPVAGQYVVPTVLGPYEAVWAKVSEPTTWTVSAKPVYDFKKRGAAQKAALAKASDDWSVRVVLADEFGKQDSWNFIASGNSSDVEEPPAGMGDHVNLSIVEGGKFLAKSAKPVADEYVWNMEVSASDYRDGFLTFEGVSALAAKGLRMFVTVDGKTSEVAEGKPVKVLLKESAVPVTVRVARGEVSVAQNGLRGLRMERVGGAVEVCFEASADYAGAKARVDLVTLSGKVVATSKFVAGSGENRASLEAPQSGVYYIRAQVGSQMVAKRALIR